MHYYCECCDKTIKLKSKNRQLNSKTHNDFHRCNHTKITNENSTIKVLDETFYSYNTEHNRKYVYFLVKCGFKLFFNDLEYCLYFESKLYSNITMCFWQKF